MYEIRRGWPSNGALDEVIESDDGSLKDGFLAVLDSDTGKWKIGECAQDTSGGKTPLRAFVIAKENLRNTYVGLMSDAIIEVDDKVYTGTEFAPNDPLAIDETGVFKAASVGSDAIVGKVISFDSVSGRLRLLWAPTAITAF